jgi:subtilisin family serine protease
MGRKTHFNRLEIISTSLMIVIAFQIASCKQRDSSKKLISKETPPIPRVDVNPVDQGRVEELRVQFKQTLAKIQSDPEGVRSILRESMPTPAKSRAKTFIIRLRPGSPFMLAGENPDTPILAAGGVIKSRLELVSAVTAEFPDSDSEDHLIAVKKFLTDSLHVLSVEPDFKVKAIAVPNDPRFSELWGLNGTGTTRYDIRAANAWNLSTGSASVAVGVVDTGVDYTHQDLAANIWQNPGESGLDSLGRDKRTNKIDDDNNGYVDDFRGWDFFDGDNNPMDENSHGTHVAGTIGAVGNNGIGITGVNWNVKIVPLRFLDADGSGYISDAISAIQYSVKLGLFATNHSWGGGSFSQAMFDAIGAANTAGQLFLAAAGNESSNNDVTAHYPSNYNQSNIISVAAIDKVGSLAWFSNYGKTKVHLAAPGVAILSTIKGNSYASYQGTSMATPHVAGAAALIKAHNPSLSAADIKNRLMTSVTKLASLKDRVIAGGTMNLEAAMAAGPDTVAPNPPSGLAVISRGLRSANIGWTTATDNNDGGVISGYEVRFADTPISNEISWGAAKIINDVTFQSQASQVVATLILPSGASGYVAVKSIDGSGNLSTISTSVQLTLVPFNQVAAYSGETMDGIPTTPWIIESDSLRGRVFSDGSGRYPANTTRHLKLPAIAIRSSDNLVVRFWHRLDIENIFDKGLVTIESNLPNSEKIVESYRYKVGEWTQVELDLSSFVQQFEQIPEVQSITIGFKLASDSSIEADGWFIDDIVILGQPSALTVTGVPENNSTKTAFNVSLNQTTEQSSIKIDQYAWTYFQSSSSISDCGSPASDQLRPLSQPMTGVISELGKNVICIYAPLKDYSASVKRFYSWNRIAAVPPVAVVSGLPSTPSNLSSFTGTVSGVGVESYAFVVVANDESLCGAAAYDSWRPISESFSVTVSRDQNTIVCVKGKNAEGTIQSGYTKVSWVSDFTPPTVILSGDPPTSTTKPAGVITIQGGDVAGYVFATGAAECGAYGSITPVASKVSLSLTPNGDGPRRICVKGVDQAGNQQQEPTVLSWIQDTVVQPIGFVGLPSAVSNAKVMSVTAVASEAGKYRYVIKSGSTCDLAALKLAALRDLSTKILDPLPSADGVYTLCGRLIDAAGNEQESPTAYTWTKDTTPPTALLSNLPPPKTASMTISVQVSGAGVSSYLYSIVTGSLPCDPAAASPLNFVSSATPITSTLTTRGVYKLCVKGVDSVGNIQAQATIHTWEITTAPVLSAGLLRVPVSPNSRGFVNIGVTSPAGQNITKYVYAFAPGVPANCARVTTWSTVRSLSSPITENLGSYQGYRTLCVKGIDRDGFEQMIPTVITWLKINGAQYSPSSSLYGAVGVTSKTSSSINFAITRNTTTRQTISVKVCRLNASTGAIDGASCRTQSLTFNSGIKQIQAAQAGLSPGDHILVVLPSSGKVEPLNFSL